MAPVAGAAAVVSSIKREAVLKRFRTATARLWLGIRQTTQRAVGPNRRVLPRHRRMGARKVVRPVVEVRAATASVSGQDQMNPGTTGRETPWRSCCRRFEGL
jgi:hypothetical protein